MVSEILDKGNPVSDEPQDQGTGFDPMALPDDGEAMDEDPDRPPEEEVPPQSEDWGEELVDGWDGRWWLVRRLETIYHRLLKYKVRVQVKGARQELGSDVAGTAAFMLDASARRVAKAIQALKVAKMREANAPKLGVPEERRLAEEVAKKA